MKEKIKKERTFNIFLLIAPLLFFFVIVFMPFYYWGKTEDIKKTLTDINYETWNSSLNKDIFKFINTSDEQELKLLNAVLDKTSYYIDDLKKGSDGYYNVTLKITSPILGGIIIKEYPSLFSYEHINYYENQIKDKTSEEYKETIITNLINKINSSNIYVENTINISYKKENGEIIFKDADNLEDYLLGNIYSYQNENVSFNTFDELLCPTNKSKIIEVELGSSLY